MVMINIARILMLWTIFSLKILREMNIDAKCQRCQLELFDCNRSRAFWDDSPFMDLCAKVRDMKFDIYIAPNGGKFALKGAI